MKKLLTNVKQFATLTYLEISLNTLQSATTNRRSLTRIVTATRPLLRVSRPFEGRYIWLRKGKEGSLQTAIEMAKLVRHAAVSDEGLERFTVQKLIDARLDSHSRPEDIIEVIFRFVQSIPYIYDPAGSFDSVQDARHTLAKGYGDCDDLAVLLATMLALVGYKPRFVLARYKEVTTGFDHVYVDVELPLLDTRFQMLDASSNKNRASSIWHPKSTTRTTRIALDPCSRSHSMGWESRRALEQLTFPIFAGRVSNTFGNPMVTSLATQGVAIGLNFVPVVGPVLSALVGPIAGLFSRTQQRSEETARDQWKAQVHDGMHAIQVAVDKCQISSADGVAQAKKLVTDYYAACDQNFTKSSVAKSCRNAENEAGGFQTREGWIAAAGANCARAGSNISSAVNNSDSVSSVGGASAVAGMAGVNWPMIIVIAGGIFLLTRMR